MALADNAPLVVGYNETRGAAEFAVQSNWVLRQLYEKMR